MDEREFTKLIGVCSPIWQGMALRITGSADDADEAVQQALISAWVNRNSFGSRAKISSWICRIVINKAYNIVRKKSRDAARDNEYVQYQRDHAPPECAADESLWLAIGHLPEAYRETMTAYISCQLDHAMAAELIGCKLKTFYGRLHKAKILLKKQLAKEAL